MTCKVLHVTDAQDQKLEKKRRLAQALRQNLGKRKIRSQDNNTSTEKNEQPFRKDDAHKPVVILNT
jgi:hypothetical protein